MDLFKMKYLPNFFERFIIVTLSLNAAVSSQLLREDNVKANFSNGELPYTRNHTLDLLFLEE